jgi:hypothetical protein
MTPARICTIDATATPDAVAKAAWEAVGPLVAPKKKAGKR